MSNRESTGNIASALERNRAFAAAGCHQGAVVFPTLRLFVITCLDPRVDPAHVFGLNLSDAVVVFNYLFWGSAPPALGMECVRIEGCPDVCGF